MEEKTTLRGFRLNEFYDANGVPCSLQISSIMDAEGHIWLGCDELGLKKFTPYQGWEDISLENNAPHGVYHVANTRMHLSQSHVAAILPVLQYFAETGELPPLPSPSTPKPTNIE